MNLQDLNHLRDDKRIRFSEETVNGETVTIVSYMVADPDLWKIPFATECRGSVFNSDGECISRPFHKFFNIGENETTQLQHIQGKTLEVLEKRDGSMLVPVLVGGKIAWKTKKSFYSDVAVEAAKNVPDEVVTLSRKAIEFGLTPIFEFCSRENRIVIDYGDKPSFTLLAIRETNNGKYLAYPVIQSMAVGYKVNVISKFDLTVDDCIEQSKTLENFEGWCLRDTETGFYCKQKTEWYLRNHRARTELRERDVADMVVDETIDDIKSALSIDGFDMSPIEEIERQVTSDLVTIRETVEDFVADIEDLTDFKAIAIRFKGYSVFNLIMSQCRGKEPDYKKYWVQNMRDRYSLKCLYSNF